ncbi:hypothetical protein HPB51_024630 [Rhipicephalus microplus]|uniref:Uncharacterized protein n=1 Tax=Rhipicephalus microplus TaxID=6941 RepID=A0A9J6F8A9_RHIMP|nr:hypothetical protein HPB51_024630 [Rhipicephalus microplus]
MDRRSFKKKRETAQQFGARKLKLAIVKKKFSPATSASSDSGVRHDEHKHAQSIVSVDEIIDMPQCFVLSEETSVRRSSQAADIADAKPSTLCEDVSIVGSQPNTLSKDVDITDAQPSTSCKDARSSTSTTSSLIRARLEPCFVSARASRKRAVAVQVSLRAVSATEHKMSLMDQGDESDIETEDEYEFFLVRHTALNDLLVPCARSAKSQDSI